ncbi:MAG TPA: type VI secretion system tip protein TssI/VgrG [Myxococcaceae bacterium]|jgi:type VI secretion system secreted protein VgrG
MDLFTLTCDKLPADTRVMRLSGSDGISRLYHFVIQVVIPGDEGMTFDMGEALSASATLHINDAEGNPRSTFHGMIATVDWVEQLADHTVYQLQLVPRMWKMGLSQHGNIFVDRTIKVIIQEVFEANGFELDKDFEFRMGSTNYEKLPHVAQYRESDLAFLMRRMEREGIYFFFEHDGDHEKLVITDDRKKAQSSGSVDYIEQADDQTLRTEAFTQFVCRYHTRPGLVRVREYDYLLPTKELMKEATVASHTSVEVVSHDEYYSTDAEGQRLAQVRSEEIKAREVLYEGRGHTFDVRPGYTFELTWHPRSSFIAKYLAVAVDYEGTQGTGEVGTDDEKPSFSVRVEAIPEGVQYRPPRLTPIPRIFGTEMGTVDGEQTSTYAQIDSHGRYKVKLYFDEGEDRNGKASTWVRMLQPHGGANEGFHFPLRKDTEVMMVFLGGDPDRPAIVGVAPNAHAPSPVTVDNATHNVILTGGGTRIEIEDNDGGQYFKLTTPQETTLFHLGAPDDSGHNVHLSSKGNMQLDLGKELVIKVQGTKLEEIHKDVTEHYFQKQTTNVDSDRSLDVKGKEDTKVKGDQNIKALSDRIVKVTKNQKHEVTINDDHTIDGNQTVKVKGNQTNNVKGNLEEDVKGTLTQKVKGDVTLTHLANFTQTITGANTVNVLSDHKINILGMDFSFKASADSETVGGIKNENILGAKIESVVGLHTDTKLAVAIETFVGAKISTHIGPSIEFTAALQLGKRGLSLATLDVKVENTTGPAIENAALRLACAAINIFP